MSTATQRLEEAIRAREKAAAAVEEANEALNRARGTLADANVDVRNALLDADKELPACVIVRHTRFNDVVRCDGVIVNNTGKTITARIAGSEGGELSFRKTRGGAWHEHPLPMYGSWHSLKLPEGQ